MGVGVKSEALCVACVYMCVCVCVLDCAHHELRRRAHGQDRVRGINKVPVTLAVIAMRGRD